VRNNNALFPEDDPCIPKHGGNIYLTYVKGKRVPLQAWTGQEVAKELRFPDFVI
jgi:hypothetical protein